MFLCLLGMYLKWNSLVIVVVQLPRSVQLSGTQWTAACQASLSFTITLSLFKFMSIESVMLSDHLILCCPLLLLFSVFSGIRVFSSESALWIRWPKDWSFSCSISPSNEYSGFISFRILPRYFLYLFWSQAKQKWENILQHWIFTLTGLMSENNCGNYASTNEGLLLPAVNPNKEGRAWKSPLGTTQARGQV